MQQVRDPVIVTGINGDYERPGDIIVKSVRSQKPHVSSACLIDGASPAGFTRNAQSRLFDGTGFAFDAHLTRAMDCFLRIRVPGFEFFRCVLRILVVQFRRLSFPIRHYPGQFWSAGLHRHLPFIPTLRLPGEIKTLTAHRRCSHAETPLLGVVDAAMIPWVPRAAITTARHKGQEDVRRTAERVRGQLSDLARWSGARGYPRRVSMKFFQQMLRREPE